MPRNRPPKCRRKRSPEIEEEFRKAEIEAVELALKTEQDPEMRYVLEEHWLKLTDASDDMIRLVENVRLSEAIGKKMSQEGRTLLSPEERRSLENT